jgi:predicted nucleic acid-binding protein
VIHLDANFLIRALVPGTPQDESIQEWLSSREVLGISTLGWAEVLCGPLPENLAKLAEGAVTERVPVLEEDAALAADLFNATGRRRGSLADCIIAATALRFGVSLATINVSDFRRFEKFGLRLVG